MPRPRLQLEQLTEAKQASRSNKTRLSLVLKDVKRRKREYFSFRDGELEIYDSIGKAEDQVSLTREELTIITEMEGNGNHSRSPRNQSFSGKFQRTETQPTA